MDYLKLTKECHQNLLNINATLPNIETKGDGTMYMYQVRVILNAVLDQIKKDNEEQQKGIVVDNTTNPEKKSSK